MTAVAIDSEKWNRRRWLAMIASVALLQLLLIVWLSRNSLPTALPSADGPTVCIADNHLMERLALNNPVQFALPNRHGFSGGAWLEIPPLVFDSPEWTEPPRPLALALDKLGSALHEHAQTDPTISLEPPSAPEPQLEPIAPLPDLPAESMLTIEGELSARPLVSSFKLESIPAPEILSNSVVQVGVNRDGSVFSAVLADGPKESKEGKLADATALNYARAARFQPLMRTDLGAPDASDASLQWGRLVFHWRTVPAPATNATVANP
jgi:hypothetical protein